jgi:hypothetical protein
MKEAITKHYPYHSQNVKMQSVRYNKKPSKVRYLIKNFQLTFDGFKTKKGGDEAVTLKP